MRLFAAISILVAGADCIVAADDAPPVSVSETSGEVRVIVEKEATIIDITDPRGIGRAELKRTAMKWPAKIVLRLHLKGLESLKVTVGKAQLGWWVGGGKTLKTYMVQWKEGKETSLDGKSAWWSEVKRVEEKEMASYFELTLPAGMFAENPETMHITWVDFYR